MQEADELDTCRICSAPAEPDQPLFHPCKCSGTIRYIHQDCLTTWLAHSKKKTCDVCKHPYSFTKVYASDMPPTLPPVLLVRRLAQQVLYGIIFGLRAVAVALIWLAVLPWVTVWTWRLYFSMGESTAWWISDRPRPESVGGGSSASYKHILHEPSLPHPETFIGRLTSHPLWLALSADIFTGQIIASLIVLTFVAVFLLREWISQNARPGVFEDEDVLVDEPAADPPGPAVLPPQNQANQGRQPQDFPGREILAVRQLDAIRALDEMRARDKANRDRGEENARPFRDIVFAERDDGYQMGKSKGKGRNDDSEQPARFRRRIATEDEESDEYGARKARSKLRALRFRASSLARPISKTQTPPSLTPFVVPDGEQKFDFTFKPPSSMKRRSSSEPRPLQPLSPQAVSLRHPETQSINQILGLRDRAISEGFSTEHFPDSTTSLPSTYPTKYRRPPLPTTTLTTSGSNSPFLISPTRTPLESPSLATYRAPEELEAEVEAGPSRLGGYFDNRYEGYEDTAEEDEDKYDDTTPLNAPEDGMDFDSDPEDEVERDRYFASPDLNLPADGKAPTPPPLSDTESDDSDVPADQDRDEEPHAFAELFRNSDDEDEADEGQDGFEEEQWDDEEAGEEGAENEVAEGVNALAEGDNGRQEEEAEEAGPAVGANEELEGNVEDDMEGALEAIGMRGPIYGVFQNAALMIFVLDTAIGLGIWLPFTIGKSTALLSLDPRRFLKILHLPIRGMRIVTDPVVDSIAFTFMDLLLPPFIRLFRQIYRLSFMLSMLVIGKLFGPEGKSKVLDATEVMYNKTSNIVNQPWAGYFPWASFGNNTTNAAAVSNATDSIFHAELPDILKPAEPYFALIGQEVRISGAKVQDSWIRLALGDGPIEKVFAIFLGYAVAGLFVGLYLNILTVGNARNAGRAVRSAVRQQLLVLKVAAFIFIELVTFPLGCGIVLDLCTVWLFPEANMQSRIAFFMQAPLTAMFYHWVAGTMFMYSFAVLLSGCRGIMRPGAMWFIKDPQDQNSHPIRDILDRPTLTQLRKIGISGIMYSVVVGFVVGSVAGLLELGSKSIMPFRWKNREPLSNVPVDLLFLHLVLPYTMHYFRPKKVVNTLVTIVWKKLAAQLRLTSYFFGGRYAEEEYSLKHWNFSPFRSKSESEKIKDGSFRRVPSTDHLALPRDMRATAAVTEDGEPIDDNARQLIAKQNAEAEKARRVVKDDYMVVYLPPHFRYRVISFIALLWTVGAIFLGISVALPIQLGRSFFRLFTPREIHDGYSLIVGFYLLWICYLVGRAVDRLDKRRQRRSGDGPRGDLRILVMKRGVIWLAKALYMVTFLGVIIPTLVAFVVDLYIILPIRFTLDPTMVPTIRVVDAWALGLIYAKIGLHINRNQPPNKIMRGIQRITTNGWTRPDPVTATKEVIGPLTGGLLGMILFPGAVFQIAQYIFPAFVLDDKFIFMHVYPGIFMVAGLVRSSMVLYELLSSWSQSIRDKEFLVEMRLRNHEPDRDRAKVDMGSGGGQTNEAAQPEEEDEAGVNIPQA